jgi:hypothetical protein
MAARRHLNPSPRSPNLHQLSKGCSPASLDFPDLLPSLPPLLVPLLLVFRTQQQQEHCLRWWLVFERVVGRSSRPLAALADIEPSFCIYRILLDC